jgi:hypothetical protein
MYTALLDSRCTLVPGWGDPPFVSVCLPRLASRPRPSIVWRVKEHMARNGGEEAGRPNLPSARG